MQDVENRASQSFGEGQATMISRLIATSLFSDRTEFSVTTGFPWSNEQGTPRANTRWLRQRQFRLRESFRAS